MLCKKTERQLEEVYQSRKPYLNQKRLLRRITRHVRELRKVLRS